MNWNGTYWGLVRHIGPYEDTTEDQRRANSRSGGPHAGNGNWMMTLKPTRSGQTETEQPYHYSDAAVVTDFDVLGPAIGKVPGARIGGPKKNVGNRGVTTAARSNRVTTRQEYGAEQNYNDMFSSQINPRRYNIDNQNLEYPVPVHMNSREWKPHPINMSNIVKLEEPKSAEVVEARDAMNEAQAEEAGISMGEVDTTTFDPRKSIYESLHKKRAGTDKLTKKRKDYEELRSKKIRANFYKRKHEQVNKAAYEQHGTPVFANEGTQPQEPQRKKIRTINSEYVFGGGPVISGFKNVFRARYAK